MPLAAPDTKTFLDTFWQVHAFDRFHLPKPFQRMLSAPRFQHVEAELLPSTDVRVPAKLMVMHEYRWG